MCCLLLATACNEKPSELTNNPKGPDYYDPQLAWSNSNNPYDTIGDYHNQVLDYVISFRCELDIDDTLTFLNQVEGYVADYCCSHWLYSGGGTCTDYLESIFNIYTGARENSTSEADLVELFAVDEDSETEMLNLISIVMNFTDSNNINSLYYAIKGWENGILNSNYSAACKKQLLISSSVMRYSLHYWNTERLLGEQSLWILPCEGGVINPKNGNIFGNSKNISFWNTVLGVLCTAAADAVGAGIGAVGGSPGGPFVAAVEAVGVGALASIGVASVYPW